MDRQTRMAPRLKSASPQHHLIICGDFNEEHSHGTLHYLESQGFERLIHQPTNLSSTEDFDNFLVDSRATTEWTGQSGVVAFDELYARRIRQRPPAGVGGLLDRYASANGGAAIRSQRHSWQCRALLYAIPFVRLGSTLCVLQWRESCGYSLPAW